jgi:MoxR-like ATPase
MQEAQVTIGETSFALEQPFLVLATQNPIEQEGTYPLPEAQVDRFMLQVRLTYPSRDEELVILDRMATVSPALYVDKVLGAEDVFELRRALDSIYLDDRLKGYIVDIVLATRRPADFGLDLAPFIQLGGSPRATIALTLAARGQALLDGRPFVTPEHVKLVAPDVFRHRLGVTYEAEAEEITPDTIVQRILDQLPVP